MEENKYIYEKIVENEQEFLKALKEHPCPSENYLASEYYPYIGVNCNKCQKTFIGIHYKNTGYTMRKARAKGYGEYVNWLKKDR